MARNNKSIKLKEERLGSIQKNNQGCLMKVIQYDDANNILVEFQDEYKGIVPSAWREFDKGSVKNPYYPEVYGVGMCGNKYKHTYNKKDTKEYNVWHGMLERCYSMIFKESNPAYQDVTCCKEWLLFDNFYEWLHSQENFDKWMNGGFQIDKDIKYKHNKIYSPQTCFLVPKRVNTLFLRNEKIRGELPIGVTWKSKIQKYIASIADTENNTCKHIGVYINYIDAFKAYKKEKESLIKRTAKEEYANGNISKECYEAMMNYEVEITD